MRNLLVLAGAVVLGCLAAPSALAQSDDFTSGSIRGAHFPLGNWTAHSGPDGVSGHMTLMFKDKGVKTELHATVECVSIVPGPFGPSSEAASVLGRVYKEDDPFAQVGDQVEFELVDGSNSGDGDEFRYNTTSDPNSGPPPDCIFGGNPTFPIAQGNVNIMPAAP
jgi:hypothetical protein